VHLRPRLIRPGSSSIARSPGHPPGAPLRSGSTGRVRWCRVSRRRPRARRSRASCRR
jgi:hypothetical protein